MTGASDVGIGAAHRALPHHAWIVNREIERGGGHERT
jgi:hypothetical protein